MALDDVTVGDPHASSHNEERHAINDLQTSVSNHISKATGAHAASAVSFTPSGTISATNVQDALVELMNEDSKFARGSVTNLNTLFGAENSGGWYFTATATNAPESSIGVLIVAGQNSGTDTAQIAVLRNGNTWTRQYYGSSWQPWRRIALADSVLESTSNLANGTNLNTIVKRQITYTVSPVNGPSGTSNGILTVIHNATSSIVYQTFVKAVNPSAGAMWTRVTSDTGATWSPWVRVDQDTGAVRFDSAQTLTAAQKDQATANLARPRLSSTVDLNNLYESKHTGVYFCDYTAAAGLLNRPDTGWGILTVEANADFTSTKQTWTGVASPQVWFRVRNHSTNTWSPWQKLQTIIQDTGWRLLYTGVAGNADFTSGSVKIRRRDNIVTLQIDSLTPAEGTGPASTGVLWTADGFAPSTSAGVIAGLVGANTSARYVQMIQLYNSALYYMGPPFSASTTAFTRQTTVLRGQLQWWTDRPFPTTLPGTPA